MTEIENASQDSSTQPAAAAIGDIKKALEALHVPPDVISRVETIRDHTDGLLQELTDANRQLASALTKLKREFGPAHKINGTTTTTSGEDDYDVVLKWCQDKGISGFSRADFTKANLFRTTKSVTPIMRLDRLVNEGFIVSKPLNWFELSTERRMVP